MNREKKLREFRREAGFPQSNSESDDEVEPTPDPPQECEGELELDLDPNEDLAKELSDEEEEGFRGSVQGGSEGIVEEEEEEDDFEPEEGTCPGQSFKGKCRMKTITTPGYPDGQYCRYHKELDPAV